MGILLDIGINQMYIKRTSAIIDYFQINIIVQSYINKEL